MYKVSTEAMYAIYLKGVVDGLHTGRTEPLGSPSEVLEWIRQYDETTATI